MRCDPSFLIGALVKQAIILLSLCVEWHLLWLRQVKQQFERRTANVFDQNSPLRVNRLIDFFII